MDPSTASKRSLIHYLPLAPGLICLAKLSLRLWSSVITRPGMPMGLCSRTRAGNGNYLTCPTQKNVDILRPKYARDRYHKETTFAGCRFSHSIFGQHRKRCYFLFVRKRSNTNEQITVDLDHSDSVGRWSLFKNSANHNFPLLPHSPPE